MRVTALDGAAVPDCVGPQPGLFMPEELHGTLDNITDFGDCIHTRRSTDTRIRAGGETARTSVTVKVVSGRAMEVAWDASKGRLA
ncbi:MAG: hypothetical protein WAO35_01985 [Terriglobia bacterium]